MQSGRSADADHRSQESPPATRAPLDAAGLRARTATRFAIADLLQVRSSAPLPFEPYLAPAILLELPEDPASRGPRPGAVRPRPGGGLDVDPDTPTLYCAASHAVLHGSRYPQWTFLWFRRAKSEDRALAVQGVRLTLREDGHPVIQEVLHDRSGLRPIYVVDSLEEAARERHGAPLPGRAFAIEGDPAQRPRTVVAATLESAPAILGPFVYLEAGAHDVITLICRCSPSQVEEVRETLGYDLAPVERLYDLGLGEWILAGVASAEDLGDGEELRTLDPDWLARCLRLPEL